jgi:glucose-1-phosphate cytidylyltransferase
VVRHFEEKPRGDGRWINGGFFVLEPAIFDYLGDDATIWEQEPLKRLSQDGQLAAYRHAGFWEAMDTLRDKLHLEQLWDSGQAPWKSWP